MTEGLIDKWRDTAEKLRKDFATGHFVSYGDADAISNMRFPIGLEDI